MASTDYLKINVYCMYIKVILFILFPVVQHAVDKDCPTYLSIDMSEIEYLNLMSFNCLHTIN